MQLPSLIVGSIIVYGGEFPQEGIRFVFTSPSQLPLRDFTKSGFPAVTAQSKREVDREFSSSSTSLICIREVFFIRRLFSQAPFSCADR